MENAEARLAGAPLGLTQGRARVRFERCQILGNRADASGGGIRVAHGTVELIDCLVRDNTAARGGGGLDASYGADAMAMTRVAKATKISNHRTTRPRRRWRRLPGSIVPPSPG